MRNPIRLKNLRLRFLPFFVIGGLALWFARPAPIGFVCGAALAITGEALRSWGAGHLVKNERLTITGPYAYHRHPLYAGTLLVILGFAVITGGMQTLWLVAIALPWFFFVYFPRKEELESVRLEERYGRAFRSYREQVPALVPALRPWRPDPQTSSLVDLEGAWSGAHYSDNNELGSLIAVVCGLLLFGLRIASDV